MGFSPFSKSNTLNCHHLIKCIPTSYIIEFGDHDTACFGQACLFSKERIFVYIETNDITGYKIEISSSNAGSSFSISSNRSKHIKNRFQELHNRQFQDAIPNPTVANKTANSISCKNPRMITEIMNWSWIHRRHKKNAIDATKNTHMQKRKTKKRQKNTKNIKKRQTQKNINKCQKILKALIFQNHTCSFYI